MINWIIWSAFGALVGWISGKVSGTGRRMNLIETMILGIVGAMLGGLLGNFIGWGPGKSLRFHSIVLSVLGALLVLWVGRKTSG
ncbi:High-affinity branched-chain amino acid transport system permease protein LivH [Clostridiaceae bacterium JG1575]|nr:High-affinity branched-chain amino acid transport system permease protein LivH [Clostridiaceae bacterium JG1575]